ncbi:MAG TPA: adenosine deaminase [Candidatus Brocadiaceae bacterium]|nr:adenosine deaminase [Candidatus Brocadiaceae bacterium]
MKSFIRNIPKAELHVHIEGTLEPELMLKIAKRNGVSLRFSAVDDVRNAYTFSNLPSFLNVYYEATSILQREQDFFDVTRAYLEKAHAQNVRHTEMFFDPQSHTERGVPFETVISGIHRAQADARQQLGVTSKLILCFLRHLSVDSAMEALKEAIPFKHWIVGVGLDSTEAGYPPEKFIRVFEKSLAEGFLTVAHAGEDGPAEYIWQALKQLMVSRVDHGVRCTEDAHLVQTLKARQTPLTVCPLSNVKLRVFDDIAGSNLKQLLDLGLCVTVNSDDPAYFGGYVMENLQAVQSALNLSYGDVCRLARNSFNASFLSEEEKQVLINELDVFCSHNVPDSLRSSNL